LVDKQQIQEEGTVWFKKGLLICGVLVSSQANENTCLADFIPGSVHHGKPLP
jgi:hypothetical protein